MKYTHNCVQLKLFLLQFSFVFAQFCSLFDNFLWLLIRGGFRGVARPISPPSERFRGWRRHPLKISLPPPGRNPETAPGLDYIPNLHVSPNFSQSYQLHTKSSIPNQAQCPKYLYLSYIRLLFEIINVFSSIADPDPVESGFFWVTQIWIRILYPQKYPCNSNFLFL